MTEEMKIALFEKMLEMERLSEKDRDYFEQSNGAFEMLKVLNLEKEYIRWSEGK